MILFLAVATARSATSEGDLTLTYDDAVRAYNGGQIAESRAIVEPLLRDHPDWFKAYQLYWKLIGRIEESTTLQGTVKSAVEYFAKVPSERRDEDYFGAYLEACRIVSGKSLTKPSAKTFW